MLERSDPTYRSFFVLKDFYSGCTIDYNDRPLFFPFSIEINAFLRDFTCLGRSTLPIKRLEFTDSKCLAIGFFRISYCDGLSIIKYSYDTDVGITGQTFTLDTQSALVPQEFYGNEQHCNTLHYVFNNQISVETVIDSVITETEIID